MRLYSLGTIIASAGQTPAAAQLAYQNAFEQGDGRRKKPWIELAPLPPGMPPYTLAGLHRAQLHSAVARALGKRRGSFAASCIIDLYADGGEYVPRPYLVLGTTRFRRPFKGEDRIDLAVLPCTAEFFAHYASPAPPEFAAWAFDTYAPHACYKVIVTCGGLRTDDWATFGVMRPIR